MSSLAIFGECVLGIFPALCLDLSGCPLEISFLHQKMFLASETILYCCKIIFESVLLSHGQWWPLLYHGIILLLCPDSSLTHQPGCIPFFKARAKDWNISRESEPLLLFSPRLGPFPLCQYWGRWGKDILKDMFKQVLCNDTGHTSS